MADSFIPYGRQVIEEEDIAAVAEVLRSDWLTTGPMVDRFEQAFAAQVGARFAVANSNGTAALHLCMLAAGIGSGDEVIVAALTFVASANCARYLGATVVFADVRADTLTIDVAHVESLITPRTRAIVAVDYGGLPADLDELTGLAQRHGLMLVEDASHSPGADYRGRKVGSIAHLTSFSFHPVKHLTTGEGGMVTTNDAGLYERLRRFRNHGIDSDHRQREREGTWRYDMVDLGFNYRLNDIQCALGLSQLRRLPSRSSAGARSRCVTPNASAIRPSCACRPRPTTAGPRGICMRYAWPERARANRAERCSRSCARIGSASTCTICRCTAIPITRGSGTGRACARSPSTLTKGCCRCRCGPVCPMAARIG